MIYLGYKRVQRKKNISKEERHRLLSKQHANAAERVYKLATQMQGLLIKTCQFISSRADVAPVEYVTVLSRLQDRVPPRPYKEIREHIRKELGAYPEDIFATFERKPLAAASLAQVHVATTEEGRKVAVKVQYPHIARVVETDLSNLSILVRILARIEPRFDFRILIEEVRRYVPQELDFEREGRSAERIAREMSHRKDFRVPEIIWEHSSRRVLTMEFMDGIKITDRDALKAANIDQNEVAQIMMETFCEQILVNGFFHADPHPGNLLVQPGPVVVFIDFGLSKELPDEFRVNYARLTAAIVGADDARMVKAFRVLGFKTQSNDPASLTALGRSFFESAGPEQRPYVDKDVMADVNERMAVSLNENPVTQIPPDILLVFRVLGLMSGLQKQLESTIDMAATITPYAQRESQSSLGATGGS